MAVDVTDADFEQRVLERSAELPVLVDFWAEWCQPCHMLAPVIEKAVEAHAGKIELAKLDVDANQATAARFEVRSLPTVKAFRDGRVATEFTGAQPAAVVERFVDGLVPSPADDLAESEDESALRKALELDPGHAGARRQLGRLLLRRGEPEAALAALAARRFDLLLTDIKMPGLDGLSAARHVAGERMAAVLILTAFSQRELVEQARDAGALAYLVKPFQKSDLIPAIEMALGRFEQIVSLENENADLAERLEARKIIDRAKGRLMDEHSLSEAASWRFLQKAAMDSRRKIHEVASDVVSGALTP